MEVFFLFKIGDKIVYPNQGVGVIDNIEPKYFNGHNEKFYYIHLFNNPLKLMMPESRIPNSHIRMVSDELILNNLFDNLPKYCTNYSELNNFNSKDRYNSNYLKIKDGSIENVIHVILDLTSIKKKQHLNTNENAMLIKTKKIFAEEIGLIKNISKESALDLLDKQINNLNF